MLVPLGGWKKEQSSLVAYMDVSILLVHKEQMDLWLGTGWYRPSFSSRRDEPLYCYHELLLLVCCCSLADETRGRDPATCCHKSCHEVLQLETSPDKHPRVLPQVPVLPAGASGGFLFPIQKGHGLPLGGAGAGVDPRTVSNRHIFPFGHQQSDLALPSEVYLHSKPDFQQDPGGLFIAHRALDLWRQVESQTWSPA